MDTTLGKLQNQWNSQGVRILVLTSLCTQIGLMFLAPLRQRSKNKVLTLTIGLFYLIAELVPPLALSKMGKQINPEDSGDSSSCSILWASFLLLHLGGPDNITSHSLNDNELWWRLPLGLVVQVGAAVYAFWQSPPNPVLLIPTTLVCIAGIIKFSERTLALRSGNREYLKDEAVGYSQYHSQPAIDQAIMNLNPEGAGPANETKVDFVSMSERKKPTIHEGYFWFNVFKKLFVDITIRSGILIKSQDFFLDLDARDAFNVVSIELSFLHDILHTKAAHLNSNLGRLLRCFSLVLIIAALIVFHHLDMQNYASKDIIITDILFSAGLALEVIATFLLISSDWTVASLSWKGWRECACAITSMVEGVTFGKGKSRWSRNIGQFNLVGLCLRDRYTPRTWIMRKLINQKKKWDNMRESKLIPMPEMLEEYMFIQSKMRAPNLYIYNVVIETRSDKGWKTLKKYGQLEALGWSMHRDLDECIILWHVATDICYYKDTSGQPKENKSECVVGWMISNYMVYLLTQQQSIMLVRLSQDRFYATCNAVKKIFRDQRKLDDEKARQVLYEKKIDHFDGPTESESESEKDGQLLLVNSLRLAAELHKLNQDIKWQLISEVWLNMLIYTAIHSDSYQHAKALTRGGELLTHVWLLMAQLGLVQERMMLQLESDRLII